MNLYTIGFAQKSAEEFFGLIKEYKIDLVVDVRLNNKSQLAGFTKEKDLAYFLKEICGCGYEYGEEFAPTKELADGYKKNGMAREEYVRQYTELVTKRGNYKDFADRFAGFNNVCLLCSEPTVEKCHRKLLADMLADENPGITVEHI